MSNWLASGIYVFAWFDIGYFLLYNTWYLWLITLAGGRTIGAHRGMTFADYDKIFRSPLLPPITIVVPAYNEEAVIVDCVRGLLDLRYPEFEVIVVDDGSKDRTLERLRDAFGLAESPRVIPAEIPLLGKIHSVHAPRGPSNLVVIRKEGTGRPGDAVNAGVNAARNPLVCRIDADTYLDQDALLTVAKPFIEDPEHTIGVGGAVRVANGSVFKYGRVIKPRMPGGWLLPIQVVEYLRAFQLGRTGWSAMRGMLFIPGVFGLFSRDIFIAIGGYRAATDGDDVDFVIRLHERMRQERVPYRVCLVHDPCCWTVAPATVAEIGRQRRRWAQSLSEALKVRWYMFFNPRYGFIGMVVMPYFLLFELGSAVVELTALIVFPLGLILGILDPMLALLYLLAAIGYAALLSVIALVIEEFTYKRYRSARDIAIAAVATITENVGFRQMHAWWRLRGMVTAARGRLANWESSG